MWNLLELVQMMRTFILKAHESNSCKFYFLIKQAMKKPTLSTFCSGPNLWTKVRCSSVRPAPSRPSPPKYGSALISSKQSNVLKAHATIPSFSANVIVHVLYTKRPFLLSKPTA